MLGQFFRFFKCISTIFKPLVVLGICIMEKLPGFLRLIEARFELFDYWPDPTVYSKLYRELNRLKAFHGEELSQKARRFLREFPLGTYVPELVDLGKYIHLIQSR